MRVEIYSDVVCPWCYIGKRRFEKALATFDRRDEIEVVWLPYQLDPTAPIAPSPVIDGYARKFGGPQRAMQIIEHVTSVAAEEGLDFHMEIAQRANTLSAHRVIWFAERFGAAVQDAVKERLLLAYFTEGRDVADHATLVELAEQAGLRGSEVAELLAGEEGLGEVREQLALAAVRGVSAVPTFILDGRFAIPGAQDPEVFVQMLERMATRHDLDLEAAAAGACDDEVCAV